MNGVGVTAQNDYFMSNEFFSGCHYETVYDPCDSTAATDYEHNVFVNNFPDNWDIFLDNHAFATGCNNFTVNNGLVINDGFYSGGGTNNSDTSSNDFVTNNRISEAYHTNGGSLGVGSWNTNATTITSNIFDDTLSRTRW
jgi:hypothetical protein